jgi:hypothetical protein
MFFDNMEYTTIILDGAKWYIERLRNPIPLCPKHYLRLSLVRNESHKCILKCAECEKQYTFQREFNEQKQYVLNKLDSKKLQKLKFINLDDEAIPIAKDKISSKDNKYFVKSILTESRVGQRLVVYVGEKGNKQKTQIFIEPEIKRMAFDQNDLHPSGIFIKLEGFFNDGSSASIVKRESRNK